MMQKKCSYCGGALKFDASVQALVCEYCTSMFPIEEVYEDPLGDESAQDPLDLMDCQMYHCTSCGADLVINDMEAATYCAYCGQPAIVFDRIAKRIRPKYIIPFSISKEEAIANIRENIFHGSYVPDEIKYFKPELLRGIYIPFKFYDVRYMDRQLVRVNKSSNSEFSFEKPYYFREAVASFEGIPVDGSVQLSNDSSERLEPFYENGMVEFKTDYLAGFYADLLDENEEIMRQKCLSRVREMYQEKLGKTLPEEDHTVLKSKPKYKFERDDYVLVPVWFMIMKYRDQEYTIMVNGQSGKAVGAVPFIRKNMIRDFLAVFIAVSLVTVPVFAFVAFAIEPQDYLQFGFYLIVGFMTVISAIIHNIRSYKKSLRLTASSRMKMFASKRQGGSV